MTTAARVRLRALAFVAAAFVAAAALVAVGARRPGEADVVVAPPEPSPGPVATVEPVLETAETAAAGLDRLVKQLADAREKGPLRAGEVADLLLRAAELHRELGHVHEARVAYVEARDLRVASAADHWQAREAVRRLIDLEAEVTRPEPEQARLRQARELHRTAVALVSRGRYLPAVPVCERALALRRELLPAPHHDLAESVLLLGQVQAGRGELYNKAFDTLSLARQELRKTLGPEHPTFGTCLQWLAVLEDERGAFVEAQGFYQAAMEVFRTARGEFSREYAGALARLARMHRDWWVTGAEGKMLRAMQIRETVLGRDHPDMAESLQDLGELAYNTVNPGKAKDLFTQATKINERTLGPGHPATAASLSWLGCVLITEVDLTNAQAYQRRAVAIAEEAHGPDHPFVARILNQTCRLSLDRNDFDRTELDYARSLAIRERHGLQSHPQYAEALTGRARNLDEWATSCVYWEGVSVDIRPIHEAYESAVRQFEHLPNSERLPGFASALVLQSALYYIDDYQFRDQEFVRRLLDRARRMMELAGPIDGHPAYRDYLIARNQLALFNRDYAAGAALCRQLSEYTKGHYGTLFPRMVLFSGYQDVGQELHRGPRPAGYNPELLTHCREMIHNLTLVINRFNFGQSSAARLAAVRGQIEMLSGLFSLTIDHKLPLDPYQYVLAHRGQVTAARVVDQMAHDKPELAALMSQLRDTRRDLARVLYTPPRAETGSAEWLAAIRRLSGRKDDLESEIAFRARNMTKPERRAPTAAEVQAALPPGAVLIEYCCFRKMSPPSTPRGRIRRESQVLAFVVRKDRPPAIVPLGSRAEIEDAVTAWRKAVAATQAGSADAALPRRAAAIADLLWKPLLPHVGAAETLLIAADGPVSFVPFAVLPGKNPGGYLLEDYRIGYVPAGRTVADTAEAPPTGDRLLIVGDVDYSAHAGPGPAHRILGRLPGLPFAKVEVEEVESRYAAAGWTGATRLSGRRATAAAFARGVEARPRFVHFAGHGFFAEPGSFPNPAEGFTGRGGLFRGSRVTHPAVLRNQQLLCGLVLADGEHPADRLLTAEQVSGLDFRGTELVVLSACETGVGELAEGEGAMSLQRSFLAAGARAVVGSLWKVDDAATAVLMDEFYRNLWERKQSKLDALRNAQLTVLRRPELVTARLARLRGIDTTAVRPLPAAGPGARSDPTLWAAFILTGDAR